MFFFQNETNPIADTPLPRTITPNPEQTILPLTNANDSTESTFHPTPHVDAVKHPDWSKWKTSKAGQIDDKFTDFQILKPKDTFVSNSATLPSLNWSNSASNDPSDNYQSCPISRSFGSTDLEPSKAMMSEGFSIFGGQETSSEGG